MDKMDKPQAIFMEMPLHIKKNILGKLNYRERRSTRRTCKEFFEIIENLPNAFEDMVMMDYINNNDITFMFNTANYHCELLYRKTNRGCVIKCADEYAVHPEKYVEQNYVEKACADFAQLYTNRRNSINCFLMSVQPDDRSKKFTDLLKSIISPMTPRKVTKFMFQFKNQLPQFLDFLPHFESGTLETIAIETCEDEKLDDIKDLLLFNQWKLAKSVEINNLMFMPPLEVFAHFPSITLCVMRFTVGNMRILVENFLHSDTFKEANIKCEKFKEAEIFEYLYTFNPIKHPANPRWIQIKYPNSEEFLRCKFTKDVYLFTSMFELERIKK